LNASEIRSEIPGKFRNVIVEKDREDKSDRWCKKAVQRTIKEDRGTLNTVQGRQVNWIGHIWRNNCLLNNVIEGKI